MSSILPVGTQVVTLQDMAYADRKGVLLAGSVGVVIGVLGSAFMHYRIRLLDDSQAECARESLAIRKQFQMGALGGSGRAPGEDLYQRVIYRCVVGSRAYGLEQADSDVDRRGIYLPPAELHWSLFPLPEQLENAEQQECYWEIEKFLVMALKANPNVLECLYTPLIELATPPARELLGMRDAFLSRLIYQTYNGYVMSQFRKIETDLRIHGMVKWKHAMHLIRLLIAGITALNEGYIRVHVGEQRDWLLAIRRGEVPWDNLNARRLELHREFEEAFASTRLPLHPDYERANAFLIESRRSAV